MFDDWMNEYINEIINYRKKYNLNNKKKYIYIITY